MGIAEDVKDVVESLRKLRPFTHTPDRYHSAFPKITKSPLDQLDPVLLDQWLTKHKRKLAATSCVNDDSEGEDGEDDESEVSSIDSDDEDIICNL